MGHAVGDSLDNVAANFELACTALDISPAQTASCHLEHGNRVVVARANRTLQLLGFADAVITAEPGVFLTMRFADCTPLLFYDPTTRSVGLAHAGWRGTMKNVTGSVVEAMQHHFNSDPAHIRLVIGPSIGPCCYQVQDDVWEAAWMAFARPESFFVRHKKGMYFDMWRANVYQAYQAGVGQVVVSELCTACRTNEFFSHRAERGRTGRFGAFLGLPKSKGMTP
jgi:hypothetical protein